jgi:hypothetical protein
MQYVFCNFLHRSAGALEIERYAKDYYEINSE